MTRRISLVLGCQLLLITAFSHAANAEWFNGQVLADSQCNNPNPGDAGEIDLAWCYDEYTCMSYHSDSITKGSGSTIDPYGACEVACNTCGQCALPDPLRHVVNCGCDSTYEYETSITISIAIGTEFGADWWKGKVETAFSHTHGEKLTFSAPCSTSSWPPCLKGSFTFVIEVEKNIPLKGTKGYFWRHYRYQGYAGTPACSNTGTTFASDHTEELSVGTAKWGTRGYCNQVFPTITPPATTNCP